MDNLSPKDRSKCMSHIRSKNTGIEKTIFSLLNKNKIHYKKHYNIFGKPDIAFPTLKIAVFLDSDYWHGWNFPRWKSRLPKKYWQDKIENNRRRDKKNFAKLRYRGWKVIRFWGHQIKKTPEKCVNEIIDITKER